MGEVRQMHQSFNVFVRIQNRIDELITEVGSEQTIKMLDSICKISGLGVVRTIDKDRDHLIAEIIINEVCELFKVSSDELRANKRSRLESMGYARWVSMFLVKKHCAWGYKEVGQYFGGRQKQAVFTNYVARMKVLYDTQNCKPPVVLKCLAIEKKLEATLAAIDIIEKRKEAA